MNTRSQTKIKICKNNFRAFALRQGVCGLQKQNSQTKNLEVSHEDFTILEKGFRKCSDRRIAESLFVKEHNPLLSEQKYSYKLKFSIILLFDVRSRIPLHSFSVICGVGMY